MSNKYGTAPWIENIAWAAIFVAIILTQDGWDRCWAFVPIICLNVPRSKKEDS